MCTSAMLIALFFHNNTVVGLGICFRDSNGHFMLARTASFPASLTVQEGEALGLLEALNLAHALGFQKAEFESDCNVSELGTILSRCKDTLSMHIQACVC